MLNAIAYLSIDLDYSSDSNNLTKADYWERWLTESDNSICAANGMTNGEIYESWYFLSFDKRKNNMLYEYRWLAKINDIKLLTRPLRSRYPNIKPFWKRFRIESWLWSCISLYRRICYCIPILLVTHWLRPGFLWDSADCTSQIYGCTSSSVRPDRPPLTIRCSRWKLRFFWVASNWIASVLVRLHCRQCAIVWSIELCMDHTHWLESTENYYRRGYKNLKSDQRDWTHDRSRFFFIGSFSCWSVSWGVCRERESYQLDSVTSSKLLFPVTIFLPRKSYEQYGETFSASYRQCSL